MITSYVYGVFLGELSDRLSENVKLMDRLRNGYTIHMV